jgi:hypothetical protein
MEIEIYQVEDPTDSSLTDYTFHLHLVDGWVEGTQIVINTPYEIYTQ